MRCKKVPYRSKREARQGAVDRMVSNPAKHPAKMGIYYCYDCRAYHVTSQHTNSRMVEIKRG